MPAGAGMTFSTASAFIRMMGSDDAQAQEGFCMSEHKAKFLDCTGAAAPKLNLWPAVMISREEIEAEVERLASLAPPAGGRRASLIVHPFAEAPGLGLAPGIRVTLNVLKPGEQTKPI